MEYRNLGGSGLKVSELCMGTMQFGWTADEATSMEVLTKAYDAGLNFFDTADIYSRWVEGNPGGIAERILGQWMIRNEIPREQLVLATKVRGPMGDGPNQEGLSRKHLMHAIDASLERLGTDYIDLYQLHFPDERTTIEETLAALDEIVKSGKVRYIGCSNFKAWQLMQALWVSDVNGWTSFISLQPHYNLVHRQEFEQELEEVCRRYQIGVLPYSPLAGGFLTDKYQREGGIPQGSRGETSSRIQNYMDQDQSWRVHEALGRLGDGRGLTRSQMALGWLLSQAAVTSPIIGPKNLDQLEDNLGCIGLRLEPSELEELEQASQSAP